MEFTSLKGRLLVATPDMADPNFFGTVVLLVEHGPAGSLGLVLNRPSQLSLARALPHWRGAASAPATIFRGGPVEPAAVIALGWRSGPADEQWSPVLGEVGVVNLREGPSAVAMRGLRVFSGYAGWGGAQLEGELSAGGWLVTDAEPEDAFTPAPDALWHRALRRRPHAPGWLAGHGPPVIPN